MKNDIVTQKPSKDLDKHKRFAKEYSIDLDRNRAYMVAFESKNRNSARTLSSRLFARVDIQILIKKELDKRADRLQISQDKIVHELMKIAFSDISDFIDENGQVNINEADTGIIKTLKETVAVTDEGTKILKREFVMHDKLKALELLGKHLAMFNEKLAGVDEKVQKIEITVKQEKALEAKLLEVDDL